MRLERVELLRMHVPIKVPFRTSYGTSAEHRVLWVHVVTDCGEGWAECAAEPRPEYSSEYLDGAAQVITDFLVPTVAGREVDALTFADDVAGIKGHRMAKAALETALLDAQLRGRGESFAQHLGAVRDRVPAGVSVGIMDSIDELLRHVHGYVEDGYKRVKLKIEPGWDYEPVRAVREAIGPDMALQVDANTAYTRDDADVLARLDEFNLLLIEQPLPEDDVLGHALLADRIDTPICLDESIVSAGGARDAIALGATSVINIKPARVGGYLEAVRVHDACLALDVPVWCGGMFETGIGRAANLALAALPNFTLPGDTSASARYFEQDTTEPFVLEDGCIRVPTGPGIGVTPIPEVVSRFAVWRRDVEFPHG